MKLSRGALVLVLLALVLLLIGLVQVIASGIRDGSAGDNDGTEYSRTSPAATEAVSEAAWFGACASYKTERA